MHHTQWQDLIPFYVAQTLSEAERPAFEAHLADCVICQRELAEWRSIAGAVWAHTDSVARSLPPLSPEVYNRLTYRQQRPASKFSANPPRPRYAGAAAQPGPDNAWRVPAGVAAGLIITIFFAAFVILTLMRPQNEDRESPLVALASTETQEAFGALDPGGPNPGPASPTALSDFGIISPPVPTMTVTAQPPPVFFTQTTPVQLPAIQATPPSGNFNNNNGVGFGGGGDDTGMGAFNTEPLPDLCTAYNEGSQPIDLYRAARFDAAVIRTLAPGQSAWASVISAEGWYQLIESGTGILGWVRPEMVVLRGPCGVVPLATATLTQSVDEVTVILTGYSVVVNVPFAEIRLRASMNAAVMAFAQRGDRYPIRGYVGEADQRWYAIDLPDGGGAWLWGPGVDLIEDSPSAPTATPPANP